MRENFLYFAGSLTASSDESAEAEEGEPGDEAAAALPAAGRPPAALGPSADDRAGATGAAALAGSYSALTQLLAAVDAGAGAAQGPSSPGARRPVAHILNCVSALPSKHARWRWAGNADTVCASPGTAWRHHAWPDNLHSPTWLM